MESLSLDNEFSGNTYDTECCTLSPDERARMKPLSHKARASIKADGWMTIWEGAIRSGKTVASIIAWLMYISRSKEKIFFMSGKTYGSLVRNVIDGDYGMLSLGAPDVCMTKDRTGSSVIMIGEKKIYLFGASDDGAYMRLKGLTAGGWYADEVATHPETFIVEALARTAVSSDRRIFWTLNPTFPSHYIYRDFMDRWEGSPGYRRYHFTLDDNLAMSKERKEELARQYVGRYKTIYILGLRVAAEGIVYDTFSDDLLYTELPPVEIQARYVACDYGTINPCVFLMCLKGADGIMYIDAEMRWDSRKKMSQKTDEQYVDDMKQFVGNPDITDACIIVDPSASSFITALSMAGYYVIKGNNDVLPGIRRVSSLMAKKKLKINKFCVGLISEMEAYCWDEKASQAQGVEKPKKINDHGPDALRYFCMTALSSYDL